MRVAIIGSSIAGSSLACLLAENAAIMVYDSKARKDIGKKFCANVVTSSFSKYVKMLGLNPEKYIISRFNTAVGISKNNRFEFKTDEFKIDREKLIEDLIARAEKKGVQFNFGTKLISLRKEGKNFLITFERGEEIFTDEADILVGADGALSEVAKKTGLWNDRRFYLVMQTEIPLNNLKTDIKKGSYNVYAGKEFGYYSYVFPSKDKVTIGVGDVPEKVKEKYNLFLKFLGIKKTGKMQAALIPEPKVIPQKKNLFLIGDAGCHVKFSGGGIIPAILAANAIKEIIVNKNYKKLKELNRRTFFNKMATKMIWKMNDKDFDDFFEILKDRKFQGFLEKRDELEKKEYFKLLDRRLLKFFFKIL